MAMRLPHIMGTEAITGGPVTFIVAPRNSPDRERWITSSRLVQEVLLGAFVSGSGVSVELVPGSNEIKRVLPHSRDRNSSGGWPGGYSVSRIATQRGPDGSEHLEAFLKQHGGTEVASNVFDPFLQAMILAAFGSDSPAPGDHLDLEVVIEDNVVVKASIGER